MKRKFLTIILIIFAGSILTGCSQEDSKSTKSATPAKQQAEQFEMVTIDPTLASKGKDIYNQNCVFCHQPDAIGKPGFAPSLTNQEFLRVSSDKFIMSTIRDGRAGTGMPPFAHLGRKSVEAIVAYLRAHATQPNVAAKIDAQPVTQGDARLGKFWFEQICITCHGPNGDGYIAGGTGTAIGKAGFLDKVSDGFIRVSIKDGRTNTRMIGYSGPAAMADLSDREIDDIIAYLRTVPSK